MKIQLNVDFKAEDFYKTFIEPSKKGGQLAKIIIRSLYEYYINNEEPKYDTNDIYHLFD
jgi:hypothetical protein